MGLGRAFTLMLPTFLNDRRVQLVAGCDPHESARAQFERDFSAPTYDNVEALCDDPNVQMVYIATPHQLHCAHVGIAAAAGKHILVEKPMAISIEECTAMIAAAQAAGVHLIVGHSHSFDAPVLRARDLIASGRYGSVRMITAMNFTDFLYRPRRVEELDTRRGGGVVHSQAAHQMDIIRAVAGSPVRTIKAHTGAWDPMRPTEGAYSALLHFENGAFASATYSGYGHFDSDALMDNISETGHSKEAKISRAGQRRAARACWNDQEAEMKAARNYGGSAYQPSALSPQADAHQHFGHIVICCDHADLRPMPRGVMIDADDGQTFVPLPVPAVPRQEVIDEIFGAVIFGQAPLHSGLWARATTELCLAILESSASSTEKSLKYQDARTYGQ